MYGAAAPIQDDARAAMPAPASAAVTRFLPQVRSILLARRANAGAAPHSALFEWTQFRSIAWRFLRCMIVGDAPLCRLV